MKSALAALILSSQAAIACDLALVLAVDVSGSIDDADYRVQMNGMAQALRDGVIAESLIRGQSKLALVQWSGTSRREVTIPWVTITDYTALDQFARGIETHERLWRNYATAIGEAITLSADLLAQAPECTRKIIDISGDGESNEGPTPQEAIAQIKGQGITINAIAIEASTPDLTAYFYENVIAGEGAFVETALSFEDYPAAIRRKLLREIAQQISMLD